MLGYSRFIGQGKGIRGRVENFVQEIHHSIASKGNVRNCFHILKDFKISISSFFQFKRK